MAILNLTQHPATDEQRQAGAIDLQGEARETLCELLTFASLPDRNELLVLAEQVAQLAAANASAEDREDPGFALYALIGGARKETLWGAQPVAKAMSALKSLYDDGKLKRGRLSLGGNWMPGFPKWNYVYDLPDEQCQQNGMTEPARDRSV